MERNACRVDGMLPGMPWLGDKVKAQCWPGSSLAAAGRHPIPAARARRCPEAATAAARDRPLSPVRPDSAEARDA
ncbi:MAG TPA: hypothetical protein VGM87_23840, partial [Roseomonas sp.]